MHQTFMIRQPIGKMLTHRPELIQSGLCIKHKILRILHIVILQVEKRRSDMATKSFFEDLIIDTPEAAANLEKAYDRAKTEPLDLGDVHENIGDIAFAKEILKSQIPP